VGYRSVTHVLAVPSPELFRPYFPDMEEQRFEEVFDRFAHVILEDQPEPDNLRMDVVRLPIRTMSGYAAVRPEDLDGPP
jgi:hypothetical protein